MNKAKKMIVSGVAGLTLFAGGLTFADEAESFFKNWLGEDELVSVRDDVEDLDLLLQERGREILLLKTEKQQAQSEYQEQKGISEGLESKLTTIESSIQKMVDYFLPEYSGKVGRESIVAFADGVNKNPQLITGKFNSMMTQLETEAGVASHSGTPKQRLTKLIAHYDDIRDDLVASNEDLAESQARIEILTGDINRLESEKTKLREDLADATQSGSEKDEEIVNLSGELKSANDSAVSLKNKVDAIMGKYRVEIEKLKKTN